MEELERTDISLKSCSRVIGISMQCDIDDPVSQGESCDFIFTM